MVDGINLTLTPGTRYAAIVDLQGYLGYSVHFQLNQISYPQGSASWEIGTLWAVVDRNYNTQFRAEFAAIPEPATGLLIACGIAAVTFSLAKRRVMR